MANLFVSVTTVAVLDTGATANLVCFEWFENHNSHMQKLGIPEVSTYPTAARFEFCDGRVGEVRYAADIKVGIAGRRGAFTAFALEADAPALLSRRVPESLGGRLDFARGVLTIRNRGADMPCE